MRIKAVTIIITLLTALFPAGADEIKTICPDGAVPGEFIVKMKTPILKNSTRSALKTLERDQIQSLSSNHGLTTLNKSVPVKKRLVPGLFVTKNEAVTATLKAAALPGAQAAAKTAAELRKKDNEKLAELRSDADVEYAYPNCIIKREDQPAGNLTLSGTVVKPSEEGFSLPHIMFAVYGAQNFGVINSNLGLTWNEVDYEKEGFVTNEYADDFVAVSQGDAASPKLFAVGKQQFYDAGGEAVSCALHEILPTYSGSTRSGTVPLLNLFSTGATGGCDGYSGDVEGDGYTEVIVAGKSAGVTASSSKIIIFGVYPEVGYYSTQFNHDVLDLKVADTDGDGLPEMVALTQEFNPIYPTRTKYFIEILEYRGNYQFVQNSKFEITETPEDTYYEDPDSALALADFDRDGDLDLVVTGNRSMWIMRNAGNGTFTSYSNFKLETLDGFFGGKQAEFVDLDNDGWEDIIAMTGSEIVLMKNAAGTFPYYTRYPSDGFRGFSLTDVQGDGYTDIVVTNSETNTVYPILTSGPDGILSGYDAFDPNELSDVNEYKVALEHTPHSSPLLYNPSAVYRVGVRATHTSNSALTYHTYTDAEGKYAFKGLKAGTYRITLELNTTDAIADSATKSVNLSGNVTDVDFLVREDLIPTSSVNVPYAAARRSNDPGFDLLWGHHNGGQLGGTVDVDMDIAEAWGITRGDSSVIVAVLDDAVAVHHPDLKNNIAINTREIPDNGIDDDGNGYVDDYYGLDAADGTSDPSPVLADQNHGTHVAGIIAATGDNNRGITGVAPGVKLLPVKTSSNETGFLDGAGLFEGFQYVYSRILAGENVRALNGSFGHYSTGPCPEYYEEIFNALANAGVSLVFSAGNGTVNQDEGYYHYPSGCKTTGLISVAAVDKTGAIADFSDYGVTEVDVASPGVDIWSTGPFPWASVPESGFYSTQGTSMASPNVAGVVALLVSKYPNFTPAQVKERIGQSVKPLESLSGKIVYPGIVSAYRALVPGADTAPPAGGGGGGTGGGGSNPGLGSGSGSGGGSGSGVSTPADQLAYGLKVKKLRARFNKRKKKIIIRAVGIEAVDGRILTEGYMHVAKKKKSKKSPIRIKRNGKMISVVSFKQKPLNNGGTFRTKLNVSLRAMCTCEEEGGLDRQISVRIR